MFGISYVKFQPSEYVLRYKRGELVARGTGLSFFYIKRNTSIAMLPVGSIDAPFIFEDITADYQTVTVQGELIYKINDKETTASMLDYTLKLPELSYRSEDPKKLSQRMINTVKINAKKKLSVMNLTESMRANEQIAADVLEDLRNSLEIASLGLEILSLTILAILPNKETARALEAQSREEILKTADEAIYKRRNFSIEQERKVKENEYTTEISVENKKRQVREAQLDAEQAVQSKHNALREEQLSADIAIEEQREKLVELSSKNAKAEADVKAYALETIMKTLSGVDPRIIESLTTSQLEPSRIMALAFKGLSDRADDIGQLNITPDLLREIMGGKK
jgi:regulator of protease activity HflC (stomatin/prohibitin superfamily)